MHTKTPIAVYEKQFYDDNCFWLIAYVSDICNFNCKYCYNKKPRTGKLLDLDELYKFVMFIKLSTGKNIYLELIGGEPTFHPKLCLFCKFISPICSKIEVFTNLSANVNLYSELIKHNVHIFASWHSSSEDFIEKAKCIGSNNVVYCVMFENDNWEKSTLAFEQLFKLFPDAVETSLIGETDYLLPYAYSALLRAKYSDIASKILKYKDRYQVTFSDKSVECKSFNDMYLNNIYCFNGWKCDAKKCHMYVHVDGNIYPCQSYYDFSSMAIGNIYLHNSYANLSFKPVICKFNVCSCTYSIKKEALTHIFSQKNG